MEQIVGMVPAEAGKAAEFVIRPSVRAAIHGRTTTVGLRGLFASWSRGVLALAARRRLGSANKPSQSIHLKC